MAALGAARDTQRDGWDAKPPLRTCKMAANGVVHKGGMVALNSSGYAGAATPTSTVVVGVAEQSVDNTGGANGAKSVTVRRGRFKFANQGTDLVTQADIATAACYVQDDQTVRHTATNSIVAGVPVAVESDGVWVDIG